MFLEDFSITRGLAVGVSSSRKGVARVAALILPDAYQVVPLRSLHKMVTLDEILDEFHPKFRAACIG